MSTVSLTRKNSVLGFFKPQAHVGNGKLRIRGQLVARQMGLTTRVSGCWHRAG